MAIDSGMFSMAPVNTSEALVDTLVRMQDNAEVKVSFSPTSVALTMADDMSALLSAFLQNRRPEKNTPAMQMTLAKECEAALQVEKPAWAERLRDFAKGADSNARALLAFLRQMLPDPAEIALLLQAFIRQKKSGKTEDDELTEVSLELLEETFAELLKGPEKKNIKAGLNSENQVRHYSSLLQADIRQLRQSYRDFIAMDKTPTEIYQQAIETFGIEKRYLVMEFINRALHCDINTQDPSCSLHEFGLLLEVNFRMNLLQSADRLFMQTIKEHAFISLEDAHCHYLTLNYFLQIVANPEQAHSYTFAFIKHILKYQDKKEKLTLLQHIQSAIAKLPALLFSPDGYQGEQIKYALNGELSQIMDGFAALIGERKIYG